MKVYERDLSSFCLQHVKQCHLVLCLGAEESWAIWSDCRSQLWHRVGLSMEWQLFEKNIFLKESLCSRIYFNYFAYVSTNLSYFIQPGKQSLHCLAKDWHVILIFLQKSTALSVCSSF